MITNFTSTCDNNFHNELPVKQGWKVLSTLCAIILIFPYINFSLLFGIALCGLFANIAINDPHRVRTLMVPALLLTGMLLG